MDLHYICTKLFPLALKTGVIGCAKNVLENYGMLNNMVTIDLLEMKAVILYWLPYVWSLAVTKCVVLSVV